MRTQEQHSALTREEEAAVTLSGQYDGVICSGQKQCSFHSMSVDMSSAFDTIDRRTILNVLSDAGCTEDVHSQLSFRP